MSIAIKVENLSKAYRPGITGIGILKEFGLAGKISWLYPTQFEWKIIEEKLKAISSDERIL